MTKKICYLIFILLNLTSYAQIAIISDIDGYVNLRSSAEIKPDNVISKVNNYEPLWISDFLDNENSWLRVETFKRSLSGFVHKSRLKSISTFDEIHLCFNTKDKAVLENDYLRIEVLVEDFDENSHDITKVNSYLTKIDNKEFWGTDGGLPTKQYKSIIIQAQDKTITFSSNDLNNLYQPNNFSLEGYYDKSNDVIYLSSLNSDGAGSYLVLWTISNKKNIEKYAIIPM